MCIRHGQIVETIQMDVVKALTLGNAVIDEIELLDQISQFAEDHNLVGHRLRRRHTQNLVRELRSLDPQEPDTDIEEDTPNDQAPVAHDLKAGSDLDSGKPAARYFVTVSRRTGLRPLACTPQMPCEITTLFGDV